MEGLCKLVNKVENCGLILECCLGLSEHQVTLIQYGDDSLRFLQIEANIIRNHLLLMFESISGPKVNLWKTIIMGIVSSPNIL